MAHFIGIQGLLGAGKTTTGSMMAWLYKNMAEKRGGKVDLYSNFGLKGAIEMDDYKKWYDVCSSHGSVVVWDESQTQFDGRQFSSADRIIATKLLNYCRKMNSVQIMIAPNFRNIDNRIRQLTEILINVVKVGNKGIRLEYYDFQAGNGESSYGKFLHSRFLPSFKVKQIHKLNLFDTYRMVRGFPMPSTERQEKVFWDEIDRHHDEALVRLGLRKGKIIKKEDSPITLLEDVLA